MPDLHPTDRRLLNTIQTDFPITPRPFEAIARKLGLSEDEVIQRIQDLKTNMLIRRIGGNFSPDKLGYHSTLCAAQVPKDKIQLFTRIVNAYPGVTHNYQREHPFNIWFTFIAPSKKIIADCLKEISRTTSVEPILNLPATRVFKISAHFKV